MKIVTIKGTDTRIFGRQLKIKSLDVLDYSDDFDTNISIFFSRKQLPEWGSKKEMIASGSAVNVDARAMHWNKAK